MKTTYKYLKLRKDFFNGQNKFCKAHIPGVCTQLATDVHHLNGGSDRCITLEDTSTWIPVCRNCHNFIEEHDKEARDLGLKI